MNPFAFGNFVSLVLLSINYVYGRRVYLVVYVPNAEPLYLCGSEGEKSISAVNLTLIQASKYGAREVISPYALFVDINGSVWDIQPEPTLRIADTSLYDSFAGKFVIFVNGTSLANKLSQISNAHNDLPMISVLNSTLFARRSLSFASIVPSLYAVISMLLGCMMTVINRNQLQKSLAALEVIWKGRSWTIYLSILLMVVLSTCMLVAYYYAYDILVYLAIGVFASGCVWSICVFFTTWIVFIFPATDKNYLVSFSLCGRQVKHYFHLVSCFFLPVGMAYAVTWIVYRNDTNVGESLQSVGGVLILSCFLSTVIPLPSLRLITIMFTVFVVYDVFFVFLTPYFSSHSSPSSSEKALERSARSVSEPSVMEAVALGSAGKSGERVPFCFTFTHNEWVGPPGALCDYTKRFVILGFGDVILPGFLCAYTIFYDWMWEVRFRYNFVGTFIGYVIGIVVSFVVVVLSEEGQPALLYICPISLGCTVACAVSFGGCQQLIRLWYGRLPAVTETGNLPTADNTVRPSSYAELTDSQSPISAVTFDVDKSGGDPVANDDEVQLFGYDNKHKVDAII